MADPGDPEAPYQSLYRRFRPQRFEEVLGQQHVSMALRNAVREGRVGHAYLFSGPRGTGKTSTARILAKALNCADVRDGEPCGRCPSCVEIARGASLDVHELDAASNNGVDAMRDLVAHAALGTPGRWKVYIVDEVHMLSTAASNALLKTLEEPPGHVVFVLATTDPQKVLPTIRSRTQHFEFRLLGPDVLAGLLDDVSRAAGLQLGLCARRAPDVVPDALSMAVDVVDAGAVDRFCDAVVERFGRIDLWVNNAGVVEPMGPLATLDPAAVARAFEVNVLGVVHGSAAFARHVASRPGGGVLVNISSGAAARPYAGWAPYCASKAAVDQISRVVAAEERRFGLRVLAVAPGLVDTDMQALIRSTDAARFPAVERFRAAKAAGAFNSPAWVADQVLQLAFGSAPAPAEPNVGEPGALEVVVRIPDEPRHGGAGVEASGGDR